MSQQESSGDKSVEQTIAELKQQHGELLVIQGPAFGTLAFKMPCDADYARYVDEISGQGANKYAAAKQLAMSSRVYPDPDGIAAAFSKKPALPTVIANGLRKMAGGDLEAQILGN